MDPTALDAEGQNVLLKAHVDKLLAENKRLRSVLRAISQLGGENDLVDGWMLARAALEPST